MKIEGVGVSRQINLARKDRNKIACNLSVGNWALFGSNIEHEPIWLGRVMSNPEWGGQGVRKNTTTRIQYCPESMKISPKEVTINIMWYKKM